MPRTWAPGWTYLAIPEQISAGLGTDPAAVEGGPPKICFPGEGMRLAMRSSSSLTALRATGAPAELTAHLQAGWAVC